MFLVFAVASLTGGSASSESLDCYPQCAPPTPLLQLADAEEYRAKRDAARAERRLIDSRRRDRNDRDNLKRKNLRRLKDQLRDGKRSSGSRGYGHRSSHGSNDGQAGAHCMYGQDGRLIYAPRGAQCANEKGGAIPGAARANPAVTQGCASGDCRNGEGTYVWSDGTRYSGGFKSGLQHGQGALAFSNGASYVGSWNGGTRSGIGTAIFPDGRVQAGRWENNRFLGDAKSGGPSPIVAADWPNLSRPAPKVGGGEKDVVVIVGIEDYAHVANIPGAEQNAADWYRYMVKTRAVPSDRVTLLVDEDATREEMRIAAEEAARLVGKRGKLWFIFIGHGAPAASGDDGLLIGFDAQQKARSLTSRSLKRSELIEVLEGSRAKQIHVVLDACFSGKSGDGTQLVAGLQPLVVTSTQPTSDRRTTLMTAAESDQFAGPLPGAERPAFSYLILGGLRGWADENGNGRVSAGELHDYAAKTMRSMIRGRSQTPTFVGKEKLEVGRSPEEEGPDMADLLVGSRKSKSRPASRR
jgi:hypothetical protein